MTPDAFDPTFNGGAGFILPCGVPCDSFKGMFSDGFVANLAADGSTLLYSTFFGGDAQQDLGFGIAPGGRLRNRRPLGVELDRWRLKDAGTSAIWRARN